MSKPQFGGMGKIKYIEMVGRCKFAVFGVVIASALVNILYLTSSLFMLQVYDRVIPSKSISSLIALAILALLLYAFQGLFEVFRGRLLVRIAGAFDEAVGAVVFQAAIRAPISKKMATDGSQSMQDFDQVRTFLASAGPSALLDLPWLPLYICICFLFHPIVGIVVIAGGLVLLLLTFVTNLSTRASAKSVFDLAGRRNSLTQAAQRNAEVVQAMGMGADLTRMWSEQNDNYRINYRKNADVANAYAVMSKIFRAALQSGVLAVGAVLVIEGLATGGIIIAASILTSRALSPIEQIIGNWRNIKAAQQAWQRLQATLADTPPWNARTALPAPFQSLVVDELASAPPEQRQPTISGITFSLSAGSALGVVGRSSSGKSTLARAVAGIWPALRGTIRLDGAAIDQWDPEHLGKHVGYLPQDIELFSGTVAQNISRFQENPESGDIINAAKEAGVHEMILKLPRGYDTEIGRNGSMLSAGQRQRIALARALYMDPFLVVLDEPNSNLDAEGEAALTEAILSVRRRGGIAIVVAHRPSALAAVDQILMVNDGQVQAFGAKEQVFARIIRQVPTSMPEERPVPLKIVGEAHE
jgi:ATP-binding cassette subfamily C protein PrsD